MIDLTHPLDSTAPTWGGSCGFSIHVSKDYESNSIRTQNVEMEAGIGTHLDAPAHFIRDGAAIDAIPLSSLILPALVLNLSSKANADYQVSTKDILEFEKEFGKISSGSLFIAWTGWSRFWKSPDQYRNCENNGLMHFPTFSEESALLLLERNIAGIAIDTLSPDLEGSTFPVHRHILGAGKYIIENIHNGDLLPAKGATVIALPILIQGATEAPIRAIAKVKK